MVAVKMKRALLMMLLLSISLFGADLFNLGEGIFFSLPDDYTIEGVINQIKTHPFEVNRHIVLLRKLLEKIRSSNVSLGKARAQKFEVLHQVLNMITSSWPEIWLDAAYVYVWISTDEVDPAVIKTFLYQAKVYVDQAVEKSGSNDLIKLFALIVKSAIAAFSNEIMSVNVDAQVQQMVDSDSKNPVYWFVLAQMLCRAADSSEARKYAVYCFDKALEYSEDKYKAALTAEILDIIAKANEDNAYPDFRLYSYQLAVKAYPNDAAAKNNLAYFYAMYGIKLDKALELVNKAIELKPDEPAFYDTKALVLIKLKRYDEAEKFILSALEKWPNYAPLVENLTNLYFAKGEDAKSVKWLEKLIKLKPDNPTYSNNLAYVFAELGRDLNRALSLSKKAVEKDPNSPTFLDTLGFIYYKMRRFDDAIKAYTKALKNMDKLPVSGKVELYDHLGDLYLYLEKWDKARESYLEASKYAIDDKILFKFSVLNTYSAIDYKGLKAPQIDPKRFSAYAWFKKLVGRMVEKE